MGWLSGLTGALGGLAMGGPLGALAGGVAGFMGGGDNEQRQVQTQGVNLRAYTPEEQAMMDRARQTMMANMEGMTPQQREQYIQAQEQGYFQPMQQQINESAAGNFARQGAMQARGGMRGSSQAGAQDAGLIRQTAGLMGQARAQARAMGEQSFFQRDQNRMANVQNAQGIMGGLSNQRRMDSPQYSNMTMTGTNPNAGTNAGLSMLGYGAANEQSWFNKRGGFGGMFGGGQQASPALTGPLAGLKPWQELPAGSA